VSTAAPTAVKRKRGRPKKADAPKPETPVERVRRWMEQYKESRQPSVSLPEMSDAVLAHFEKVDPHLLVDLGRAQIRTLLYQIGQSLLAESRYINLGGGEMARDVTRASEVVEQRVQGKFDRWMEHVGDRHVRLKDMDRDLLALAVQKRHEQVEDATARWRFMCLIRDGLPGRKKVGEHYSDADLKALLEKANRSRTREA
jgi:hypothetical protein